MHKLLLRQLKRFPPVESLPEAWRKFIALVDEAYQQSDADRAMNERSMDLASQELMDANQQLRQVIEDLREAEEIKRAHSLLQSTLDSTADGILVVDHQGMVTVYNPRFVELWGIPTEVLETRDDALLLGHVLSLLKDPEAYLKKVRELYAQPEAESVDLVEFKDGRTFERYSIPQRLDGKPVGRVWCFHDVTTRKSLEEQIRQSQKMEAVGRLAGGVAHDFNNLLTVITGYSEILLKDLAELDPHFPELNEIRKAAARAAGLTRQLLAFSRKQVLQPKVIDLNHLVTDMERMLRRLIREDIALETDLAPVLGRVLIDPGQMEQVLLNLVVNARDAMPSGGRITIRTADVLAPGETRGSGSRPCVELSVTDNGCGMDEATQSHLFEPFFTTKELGKGTGLGLSTAYGIIAQSGGRLDVRTAPGRGTTMQIQLPSVEGEAGSRQDRDDSGFRRGSETILLVEDENAVRNLLCEVLESGGYRVLTAAHGQEALVVLEEHPGTIHLLLTDVVMPVLSGVDLVRRLPTRRSATKVLFMSGYTDDLSLSGPSGPGFGHIQKPFAPDTLVLKVRELLDSAAVSQGR